MKSAVVITALALLITGCSSTGGKPKEALKRPALTPEIELPATLPGLRSWAEVNSSAKSGAEYHFESSELVLRKDSSAFGDAVMKGAGQFAFSDAAGDFILSGGKVFAISAENVVLSAGAAQLEIGLRDGTRFCDGKGALKRAAIIAGDMAVVVSPLGDRLIASSLRKGPMLVATGGPFGDRGASESKPVNFRCK